MIGPWQDFSCFVCGTSGGFRVFCLNEDGTIAERLRREPCPRSSVMHVAMLYKSSIFAMVNQTFEPSGEPAPGCMNKALRREVDRVDRFSGLVQPVVPVNWQVQIWEERKQKVVAELRCRNEVKGVCLHRAACLKKSNIKGIRTSSTAQRHWRKFQE